jgi:hypothetical protein
MTSLLLQRFAAVKSFIPRPRLGGHLICDPLGKRRTHMFNPGHDRSLISRCYRELRSGTFGKITLTDKAKGSEALHCVAVVHCICHGSARWPAAYPLCL